MSNHDLEKAMTFLQNLLDNNNNDLVVRTINEYKSNSKIEISRVMELINT